jgi:hypothetical protein
MQVKYNRDLYDLITALAGVTSFTTNEKTQLLNFAKRRIFEAYQTTSVWPRYLTVGEERTITNSVVPYTETDKDDIAEFLRIHRTQPFLQNSALEFDFFVESDGAHVLNLTTSDASSVFVTYKKEISDIPSTFDLTGDKTTQEIPLEFFYFTAHATYADFLRMDGQHEKAIAEEQVAQAYLATELEKSDQNMNNNTITKRFHTHVTQQSR